jgi:hypothetical protein
MFAFALWPKAILTMYFKEPFRNYYKNSASEINTLILIGPKRDEVTGKWRKLHNKELHGLYFSPSMIRIIKSRRKRWAAM